MVLQCFWISLAGKDVFNRSSPCEGAEKLVQPNICVLIDVGTRPGRKSIYYLWKTFDLNSNVGGACGEIAAYKVKNWSALLNPLGKRPRYSTFTNWMTLPVVAAHNVESKVSNILDKPTESLFGYISVLVRHLQCVWDTKF